MTLWFSMGTKICQRHRYAAFRPAHYDFLSRLKWVCQSHRPWMLVLCLYSWLWTPKINQHATANESCSSSNSGSRSSGGMQGAAGGQQQQQQQQQQQLAGAAAAAAAGAAVVGAGAAGAAAGGSGSSSSNWNCCGSSNRRYVVPFTSSRLHYSSRRWIQSSTVQCTPMDYILMVGLAHSDQSTDGLDSKGKQYRSGRKFGGSARSRRNWLNCFAKVQVN